MATVETGYGKTVDYDPVAYWLNRREECKRALRFALNALERLGVPQKQPDEADQTTLFDGQGEEIEPHHPDQPRLLEI